jgi:hypothetical protein
MTLTIPMTLGDAARPSFTATATSSEGATSEFSKSVDVGRVMLGTGVPHAEANDSVAPKISDWSSSRQRIFHQYSSAPAGFNQLKLLRR